MNKKRTTEEKKAEVIQALTQCFGVVTVACRKAKIGRTQFYEWKKDDLNFSLQVKEIEEGFVDFVESKLVDMILLGDRAATMFYLKAKGKHRGYK
jgi:hypothetical protein